jgi:DNA polymerase-3 subunit beta
MNAHPDFTKADVKIDAKQLARLVPILRKVARPSRTIPVLSRVRVTVTDGGARVTATDLDHELTVDLDADATGAADVLILPQPIGVLARAAQGFIRLSVPEPDVITLSGGPVTIRLGSNIPADDFPPFREHRAHVPVQTLTQDALLRLIDLSRDFISTETTRYYLNGVFLCPHPDRGTLRAVSTDGHRMAVIDSGDRIDLPGRGVIVAAPTVDLLRRLLVRGANDPVQIRLSDQHLEARAGNWTLRAKLVDGTYPDYTGVIPKPSTQLRAHISAHAIRTLIAANNACAHFEIAARLDHARGEVRIGSGSDTASIPATIHRETEFAETWAFNARYLDGLSRTVGDLHITANDPRAPAILRSDTHPDAFWVLMPTRVR